MIEDEVWQLDSLPVLFLIMSKHQGYSISKRLTTLESISDSFKSISEKFDLVGIDLYSSVSSNSLSSIREKIT